MIQIDKIQTVEICTPLTAKKIYNQVLTFVIIKNIIICVMGT